MSVVSILGVQVLNNPAAFNASYQFEITFECLEALKNDLEWKLTYVGSATSSEYDQELDSLLVGPVPVGINKFVFETEAPDLSRIPNSEILGVTVILLSCSYESREFVRVGYYVNNEYTDEALNAEPPAKPVVEKVRRNILAEKPRVTRFAIKWDSEESAPAEFPPEQPEADVADDDGEQYGAEEEEEEVALEGEAEGEPATGEDAEMGGTEEAATASASAGDSAAAGVVAAAAEGDDDAASDAGSEDLEAESEDDEEDDEEGEQEGEQEGEDDEMDIGEGVKQGEAAKHAMQQPADVMVH